jgi:hypothetical protein
MLLTVTKKFRMNIMSNLLKKLFFSFLTALVVFTSIAPSLSSVKAQEEEAATWYKQNFIQWYTKVYDPSNASEIFGERYTAAQVEWVFYGVFAFILNHLSDQEATVRCIGGDAQGCADAIQQSIQRMRDIVSDSSVPSPNSSLTELVFEERSFSGIGYVKEKIENFKLVPEAKAQTRGFGYGALDPVKQMWAASRNAAYGLIVLATIILAFMVMFRVKISPQVVITVQSAIPKVIFALLFVTFSYAIAGFLIDLMYVVIGLFAFILGQVNGNPNTIYLLMTRGDPILGLGFLSLMAMYCVLFFWILLFTMFASGNVLINITALSSLLMIFFILIIIIVGIVFIFMFFKILWLLLKTLAKIYLLVIVGPLQIMLGTVVQGMGVGSWMKALAANLAVYPVVGVFFVVSFIFLFYAAELAFTGLIGNVGELVINIILPGSNIDLPIASWAPPLTFGESYLPLILVGVSFSIITLIPKTTEIIQGLISGKPFAYGTAIGEAFGEARFAGALGVSKGADALARSAGNRGRGVEEAVVKFLGELVSKRVAGKP